MKDYFELPLGKVTNTMVAIMDTCDDKVTRPLMFVHGSHINWLSKALTSALRSSDPSIKTRIVILVHNGRDGLDWDMNINWIQYFRWLISSGILKITSWITLPEPISTKELEKARNSTHHHNQPINQPLKAGIALPGAPAQT
jgi:hypothetical protein